MRRRASQVTVLDMFCGAGGSSIGARAAGAELRLAMNHWDLAVEIHNANFPDALHAVCDISATDPRRFRHAAGLGAIDVLVASPECTWHSQANPRAKLLSSLPAFDAAAAERSRATCFDIPRYAEVFDFAAVVVENVVELAKWAMYPAWLHAMECLGYTWKEVSANAAIFPGVPQSRDRLFIVFWKKNNLAPDLDFRPLGFCQYCERETAARQVFKREGATVGRWRAQYLYHCEVCDTEMVPHLTPAAAAIDWSVTAPRIGERDKPLAAGTLARVAAGLERFASTAGLLVPVDYNTAADSKRARPVETVFATQTTRLTTALAVPPRPNASALARANEGGFIVKNYGKADQAHTHVKPLSAPLGAVTTVDHHSLTTFPITETRPAVEECTFRMLEPSEVGRAMAFPDDYAMSGSRRARCRLYGNACVPPVMEAILSRVMETLQAA